MIINLIKNCDDSIDFLKNILSMTLNRDTLLATKDDEGWTALHHAVYLGYANAVAVLLSYHANPNIQDNKGMTPLHLATYYCYSNLKIIELLLSAGANPNVYNDNGNNALHCAIQNISSDLFRIMELLINNGVNLDDSDHYNQTALHMLARCSNGNEDAIQLLVDKGINVNLQDSQNATALHYAIWANYIDIFSLQNKDHGILLNTNNFKSCYAREDCRCGSVKAIKILIEAGTNVNLQDESQCTPLHLLLSFHDDVDIYDLAFKLVKAGSDVNLKNFNGDTSLHIVVKNVEYIQCSKALNTWLSGYHDNSNNNYGWGDPAEYNWDADPVWDDGAWDANASWGDIPNVDDNNVVQNVNWGPNVDLGQIPNQETMANNNNYTMGDWGPNVDWGQIPTEETIVNNNNSTVADAAIPNTDEFDLNEIHPDDIINGGINMQPDINYTFDMAGPYDNDDEYSDYDDDINVDVNAEIIDIQKVDERADEPRSIREKLIELLMDNGADINIKDDNDNDPQCYDAGFIKYYFLQIIKKIFQNGENKLEFGECCICMNDTHLIGCRFKHNYCEVCVAMSKLRCEMCFCGFVYEHN
jgi:ankyrin repeat protein